jgi:hypothetical protein
VCLHTVQSSEVITNIQIVLSNELLCTRNEDCMQALHPWEVDVNVLKVDESEAKPTKFTGVMADRFEPVNKPN